MRSAGAVRGLAGNYICSPDNLQKGGIDMIRRVFCYTYLAVFFLCSTETFAFRAPETIETEEHQQDVYPVDKDLTKDTKPMAPSKSVTRNQVNAIKTYPKITVHWKHEKGVPSSIRGFNREVVGDSVEAAISFLEEIKAIYRIRDARSEFKLQMVQADELGYEHVRLSQYYQGIPVDRSELIVHINKERKIYQVNGDYTPDIEISVAPTIGESEALEIGIEHFQDEPILEVRLEPELVIYPVGNRHYLAYHYILYTEKVGGERGLWRYYVDAHTGEIINRYNDIQYIDPPTVNGTHQDITGSRLSGEDGSIVTIEGWDDFTNNAYYLYNKNLWWYIYNVATSGYPDSNTYAHRLITNDWGISDRAEISAGKNFNDTQDYFKTVHSRDSFDNASAYAIGNVHQGTNLVNAYWDGTDFHFGDGDGTTANPLTTLDIVAHEYGHAWTDSTSDLTYQDESGALNESFSDIVGATVEFYAQLDGRSSYPNIVAGYADWLMGEDAWLSSTALRDMRNPSNTNTVGSGNEQPSRYHGTYWYTGTGDNGGVHINSGVQNFVYYLLSEGGTGTNDGLPYDVTGIGVANARQVACRANSNYLTSSATHRTSRQAWIDAASDLNSSWVDSVKAAWDSVGIIDIPSSPSEGFEGASPPSGWITGGDGNWFISTNDKVEGTKSAQAADIGDSESTYLQWSANILTAGIFSFFIRASSERGYDYVKFYVDGTEKTKWSGNVPWTSYCGYLTVGQHTLKWDYIKDSMLSSGSDTVWLDAASFPSYITAPTGVSATAVSTSQIDLSWTDNSSNELGFKIERKTGSGGTYSEIATAAADATSYSNTGLSAATTYYYRVRAYDSAGNSNYSSEANATTPSAGGGGGGLCFIATAVYGSEDHPYVKILQNFRDTCLLDNPTGRKFVQIYYHHSPSLADIIEHNRGLRAVVRYALTPIIISSAFVLYAGPFEKSIACILLLFITCWFCYPRFLKKIGRHSD